jgi:hypothetical protein
LGTIKREEDVEEEDGGPTAMCVSRPDTDDEGDENDDGGA